MSATVVCAVALLSFASTKPDAQGSTKVSTPFDWAVGTWEGVREDGVDKTRFPMTLRVESILGGAGITETFEVRHPGSTYMAFAVTAYDRDRKVWVKQYVNAPKGQFIALQGKLDGDRSDWENVTPGRTREAKLETTRLPDGKWQRTQKASADGGKTWSVIWQDTLAKSK